MSRRILIIVIMAVMSVFYLNGCKERSSDTQEEVKTAAEHEADAKEQINKDNMDEELERIENELEQDISQEP